MKCSFCKNEFSNRSSLHHHQKTAKYCIKLQGGSNKSYKCQYCEKSMSTKQNLNIHISNCIKYKENLSIKKWENDKKILVNKYELIKKSDIDKINFLQDELRKKDIYIKQLQDKLENIAVNAVSRSTTTHKTMINNYIQQLQPVTDKHFSDNVHHLTIDHIMKGPEGYAQYALEYPLKDRMLCVDYSRRKVKFKDKDGNVITDPEMTNLATKFFNSIKDKNKELIVECSDKLKENFGDEVDTIVKIFDYKASVDNGSDGTKTEFQYDFVKYMCSQTIRE